MRPTPLTPYLPLPQTVGGAPRAPAPQADPTSGGFTFERLRGVASPPPAQPPEAPHAARRVLGSSTTYSAAAFAVAFVVYVVTGFACLAIVDGYPPHGELESLEGAKCITAYRNAHHAEARLYVGSPPREVRLLVRTDVSKACAPCGGGPNASGASVVVTKPDVLHSTSLVCNADSTACADVAIVSRWRGSESHNELRPLRFLYGTQHLAGPEAPHLGLDGEVVLCRGVSYVLSSRQLCAASAAALGPPPACAGLSARAVPRTTLGGTATFGAFATTACDLRAAGGVWAAAPAAHARCAACDVAVALLPSAASVTSGWLTFTSSHMFDTVGGASVGAMRTAVEAGSACATHDDPAVGVARKKFDVACTTAYLTGATEGTACGRGPSVAPMRVSGHRVRATVGADGGACFVATADLSLHANAASGAYGQPEGSPTTGEAWLRLLLMVFAAAIVWVRRDDTMENADRLFVRCVQIIVEGASRTIVDVDAQTRALGLAAAVARLALAASSAATMTADGQTRVVVTESVAASMSIVHWFVLYGGPWLPAVRLLKDTGLRPALGGSSAIVDVTCATMMAFATTPVRGDVQSFDVIARLLTAVLLSVACVSRCLLSAACSGALTQCRFGPGAVCSAKGLALCVAIFWWFQAASIAVVVADLFAAPVSIDWAREGTGSPQSTAMLLFVSASLISAPRLTANAVAITRGVDEEEEAAGAWRSGAGESRKVA